VPPQPSARFAIIPFPLATTNIEHTARLSPLTNLGEEQGGLVVSPRQILPVPGPVVSGEEGLLFVSAHGYSAIAVQILILPQLQANTRSSFGERHAVVVRPGRTGFLHRAGVAC
jgi:hypothetical protein